MSDSTSVTLPQLLLHRVAASPKAVALRHHELGRWKQTTWAEFGAQVTSIAFGLSKLGVGIGTRVALIGANHPTMIASDLAALALGAVTVPIEAGLSPLTLTTLLKKTAVKFAVVGDQQQFDKIGSDPEALRALTTVVIVDTRGMHDLALTSWTGQPVAVLALAQLIRGAIGSTVDLPTTIGNCKPEDPATVDVYALYGSPTETVARTHGELSAAGTQHHPDLQLKADDELLAVLSMARPRERALTEVAWLQSGAILNVGIGGLVEGLELQQVQPTVVQLDAQRLETMRADIVRRLSSSASSEGKKKRRLAFNPITMVFRTLSRLGHQFRLRSAMKTLAGGRAGISRSAQRDSRVFRTLLVAAVATCLLLNSHLRSIDGGARIGLCVAVLVLAGVVAMGTGVAIRPFVRKAYGLNRARHLVAFDALGESVIGAFSGLHLAPTGTTNARSTPLAGTDLDSLSSSSGRSNPSNPSNSLTVSNASNVNVSNGSSPASSQSSTK
jgi:long-subunit acyl-CoA synthetase (AMP-forming)